MRRIAATVSATETLLMNRLVSAPGAVTLNPTDEKCETPRIAGNEAVARSEFPSPVRLQAQCRRIAELTQSMMNV